MEKENQKNAIKKYKQLTAKNQKEKQKLERFKEIKKISEVKE